MFVFTYLLRCRHMIVGHDNMRSGADRHWSVLITWLICILSLSPAVCIQQSATPTLTQPNQGIHGTAPRYLSDLLHRVSDTTSRRRLRSSTSSELVIPLSRLVTVGDRSFAVAGPRLCDTLTEDITKCAPSLLVFRRKLKTHLFRQSYPDIIL